jgi:hypothetical protein
VSTTVASTTRSSRFGPRALVLLLLLCFNALLALTVLRSSIDQFTTGTVAGQDFITYYSGGRLSGVDRGRDLYRLPAQARDQASLIGVDPATAERTVAVIGYVNPPTASLFLHPLSRLPVNSAYRLWFVVEAALLCCTVLVLSVRRGIRGALTARFGWVAVAMASVPVSSAFIQGSLAPLIALGAACFVRGTTSGEQHSGSVSSDVWIVGGLSLLAFKPQYLLLPLVYLVAMRHWRPLVASAAVQILLMTSSLLIVRPAAWLDYIRLLGTYNGVVDRYGASTSSMWNVRGALARYLDASHSSLINGVATATLVIGAVCLYRMVAAARSAQSAVRPMLVVLLLLSVIVSPHAHGHDWLIALVALGTGWPLLQTAASDRPDPQRVRWRSSPILGALAVPLVFHEGLAHLGSGLGLLPVVVAAATVWVVVVNLRPSPDGRPRSSSAR